MRGNRAAFERWRIVPRVLRDVSTRDTAVEVLGTSMPSPFVLCPDRRARDGAPRGRRRRRARCSSGGNPVRLLQPGIASDGGDRPGDGRCAALVPALLEHVERPRREPRLTRRALRLLRDRPHARHDHARVADPRPRPRVPAVPAREGNRSVHERSRVRRGAPGDPAPGGASRRPHHARCHRDTAEPGRLVSRVAARERALGRSRAPRYAASSRRTRGRRSRGTISRSSASDPPADLLKGVLHPADASAVEHGMDGLVVSNRAPGRVAGSTRDVIELPSDRRACSRRRRSPRLESPSCSTAGSAPARTSFGRSRSARPQWVSAGPYVWGLAVGGEAGVREVIRNLRPTSTSRWASRESRMCATSAATT